MSDIAVGSVVVIERFPETKWIVCSGWYSYLDETICGTYLKSIPVGSIIPLTEEDASTVLIISDGCGHDMTTGCEPCTPQSTPNRNQVEMYISGVDYERGQLVYLNVGDLYQVTTGFLSSSSFDTLDKNFDADVESGAIISIQGLAGSRASDVKDGLMSSEDYVKLSEFDTASTYVKKSDVELVTIEEIDEMFPIGG